MRVAIFIPSLDGGGAERVVVLLANELSTRGIGVDLLLVEKKGPHVDSLSRQVNVVDLAKKGVLASFFAISKYIKDNEPDFFISHLEHANIVTALVKVFSKNVKTKFLLTEHVAPSEWFKNARLLKDRVVHVLGKCFYRYADHVIAVSKGVAKDVISFYGISNDKVSVIYNPVIGKDLMARSCAEFVPLFDEDADYILGMGRLVEQKDFSVLIEAFKILKKSRKLNLLILGEGAQRRLLEDLIKKYGLQDHIKLPGHLANPYPYLKRAKVFVLSSRREALPTVLIEALALGVAVVSTNCPYGPAEILDNGRLGRIVEVGNATALAAAIEKTLESRLPEKTSEMKEYTVDFAVDAYMKLLKGIS
ncbi:MAG: glycosyltransferase [Candidatus Omnitrophica bacterium]|nr:glycosyltransferase [Candidatus Omnitrophota bacterium]